MKLLIELPTWLGDTVMATPAIENLVNHFINVEITLLGSCVSIEALKKHPKVTATIDLFFMGIVFFNTNLSKEDFVLRF